MKKITKGDIITIILCLCGIIPGAVTYNKLPEKVPVHFNLKMNPDNYAPKAVVVFLLPVIMLCLQILICFLANITTDKHVKKGQVPKKIQAVLKMIVPVLCIVIETATVMFTLGIYKNIGVIIISVIGLMFVLIGNYIPKCRRNSHIGIKLPNTLKSDYVWDKTHRLAGWIWTLGGILLIALAIFEKYVFALAALLLMSIGPVIYSFTLKDKEQQK